MLLYRNDWARYNAHVHIETKNLSFLKVCKVYQLMGIKNCLFPLALLDRELINIDPHNLTDPSEELRLRVAQECSENYWYFIREVTRVPAQGLGDIPFEANRGNIAMAWSFFNNVTYTGIQPRQTGKSMGCATISCYLIYILCQHFHMCMLTKDEKLLQQNVGHVKNIRESLPKYLLRPTLKDTNNKQGLSYAQLDNSYRTMLARADKAAADQVGRGITTPVAHIDEIAYLFNIAITFSALMSATNAAMETAKRAGLPHAHLYTTTAARTDTPSGKYVYDNIITGALPFTETLYDCEDRDALQTILDKNSRNGIINGTFSYLQLGKTHEWLHAVIKKLNAPSEDDIDRDYRNIWKAGLDTSLLSTNMIKQLNAHRAEPRHTEIVNDYVVSWYVGRHEVESQEMKSRPMVLGMDSSENVGRDFTALVLIDVTDMSVLATFRCNESNIIAIGLFIAQFLINYKGTVFIPELKSTGRAIVDQIILQFQLHGINPFRRIFNRIVQENDTEQYRDVRLDPSLVETSMRKTLGFMTTGKSRSVLYKQVLNKAVSMNYNKIYDGVLIRELSTLAVVNNRVDHTSGNHDDMVIAYLLACWLLFEGRNLQMYGLPASKVLSDVEAGSTLTNEYREMQIELRQKFKHYEALMKSSSSEQIAEHYRQKMEECRILIDPSIQIAPIGTEQIVKDRHLFDIGT